MVKNFIIAFISAILIRCTNSSTSHSLEISVDAVVKKTDSIGVYFTKNKSVEFNSKSSFWIKVKGTNKNQIIKIVFPDTIKPKQIRLDFGRNLSQNDVVLNKIDFAYKNKNFSVKGKEIFYIFRADENNTIVDKFNGSIKRKNPKIVDGPSLYPKGDKLFQRLNQLYSKK